MSITWIINIVFFAVLALFFLFGYIRGARKSILHLVCCFLGIGVAFIFCGMVTEKLLSIKLSFFDGKTLSEYIVSVLQDSSTLKPIIENSETFTLFIQEVPKIVITPIAFLVIMLIAAIAVRIVYAIVAAILFKKPKNKGSISGFYKKRFIGGLIGALEGFFFMLFLTFPLAGFTGLVNSITTPSDNQIVYTHSKAVDDVEVTIRDVFPNEMIQYVNEYNDSIISKVTKLSGGDKTIFDSLTKITINDENVYIRKEVENLLSVADDTIHIYNNYYEFNTLEVDYKGFEKSVNEVLSSGSFKGVIAYTAQELANNYEELVKAYEIKNVKVIDFLKNVSESVTKENAVEYISSDIKTLVSSVTQLGNDGILDQAFIMEGNLDKRVNSIATNPASEVIPQVIDNLFGMNVVKDAFPVFVELANEQIVKHIDKGEFTLNTEVTDTAHLGEQVKEIAQDVINLYKYNTKVAGLLNTPEDLLSGNYPTTSILEQLAGILDKIRTLDLLVVTEDQTSTYQLDKLIEKFVGGHVLGDVVLDNEQNEITLDTYAKLVGFVNISIDNIINAKLYDSYKVNKDMDDVLVTIAGVLEKDENYLENTILPLVQVDCINTQINKLLENAKNDIVDFTVLKTYEDWARELNNIEETLLALNKGDVNGKSYLQAILDGEDVSDILLVMPTEDLRNAATPILKSEMFASTRTEIVGMLEDKIYEFTGAEVEIDITNVFDSSLGNEDQTDEFVDVVVNLVYVYENDSIHTDYVAVGELMESLKANAYRTDMNEELSSEGVLREAFDSLYNYLSGPKFEYNEIFNKETAGMEKYEVNYVEVLTKIQDSKVTE